MKKLLPICVSLLAAASLQGFAADESSTEIENTDVVSSGIYTGTAMRVDQGEKEIYFKTDEGKILELYFKKDTKLMKDGKMVEFTELAKDQPLKVKVKKTGNHLTPLEVTILSEKSSP